MSRRNLPFYCTPLFFLLLATNLGFAQQKVLSKKDESIIKDNSAAILKQPDLLAGLNINMNTVNFVPNHGQYDPDVLYTFITPQTQMVVFKDRLRLISLHKAASAKSTATGIPSMDKHVVDIAFEGGNSFNINSIAKKEAPAYNWFGNDKNVSGIKACGELVFNNIYDGINLRLYSNKIGCLEFDWIVKNAQDFTKIKMKFNGQDNLAVDDKGNLNMGLHFGTIQFNIPETYQLATDGHRIKVDCKFSVNDKTASYAINDNIIKGQPLIIDPVMLWGTFMNGSSSSFDAYLYAGQKDKNKDVYIAGASQSITNTNLVTAAYGSPTTGYLATPPSGTSASSGSGVDWLIMKISKDGTKVLTYTFFGLASGYNDIERAHCLSISPNGGSIFVGGVCSTTPSISLPPLSAAYSGNTAFGGTTTAAVLVPTIAVFSADLSSLKYRTFIGDGTATGSISSIEAINDNDFIVAGSVEKDLGLNANSVSYVTGPDISFGGVADGYIAKFTNFNNLAWGTYVGGDGKDYVYDMRIIGSGNIAFVGSAASTNASMTPLVNEVASNTNRNNTTVASDGLVGVIKADGSQFTMLSKVGGTSDDSFNGFDFGGCDTLYITGNSNSTNFPNIGTGVLQSTLAAIGTGYTDAIIFKCAATGGTSGTVATYFGGNRREYGNSIAFLPVGQGRLFIFGSSTSNNGNVFLANNIAGNTWFDTTQQGGLNGYDMFFVESSTDLKTKYLATFVGGLRDDYLGQTGTPITGKQMILMSDTTIGVFTTSHSVSFTPNIITTGTFGQTAGGGDNDNWIVFVMDVKDVIPPVDGGDAPVSYGKATVEIDTVGTSTLISLGNRVDNDIHYPEVGGSTSDYDDNEGNSSARKPGTAMYYDTGASGSSTASDEDALTTVPPVLAPGTTYSVTVPYYNNSGKTATIYGYVDFNQNGSFDDAGEMASVTSLASNSNAAGSAGRTVTLTWTVPDNVVAGTSYLRLVIVEGTGAAALTGCSRGFSNPKNSALGIGEIEDYRVTINVTISGKVWDDKDGSLTINNIEAGTTADTSLYVYLNNGGVIVDSAKVKSTGRFAFNNVNVNSSYSLLLSTTSAAIGGVPPTSSLPTDWVNTGINFEGTTTSSVGNGLQNTATANLVNVNFGIDHRPDSDPKSTVYSINAVNMKHQVPGLTGNDLEDGRLGLTHKYRVTTLPPGAVLYYNNNPVSVNQVIQDYDSTLLKVVFDITTTHTSFYYAFIDSANVEDPSPAIVDMAWTSLLPVSLKSFTAAIKDNVVNLQWDIDEQKNLSYCIVEHSFDGSTFNEAGSVSAKAAIANHFNFNDYSKNVGKNYYRIKMVSANGEVSYSEVKMINYNSINEISILPNPVSTILTITFTDNYVNNAVKLELYNQTGQLVFNKNIINAKEKETLNLSKYAKGIYTLKLQQANEKAEYRKIEVIR